VAAIPLVVLIAVLALFAALLTAPARFRRIAAGLALAALGAASLRTGLGAGTLGEVLRQVPTAQGSDRSFALTGIGLILLGLVAAVLLGLRLPPRQVDSPPAPVPAPRWPEWVIFGLGLGALAARHVVAVLALLFLCGALELLVFGGPAGRRIALALALILLGTAALFLLTIIGPLPATYAALRDGPVGDPAARLLVLLLLVPSFGYLTSWRLLPAAAGLVGGLGGTLLPAGVQLWQGIVLPLSLVGMGWGIVRRRPGDVIALVGAYGLWSGTHLGRVGGYLLLGCAVGWFLMPSVRAARDRIAVRLAAGVACAGLVLTLAGGLEAQVGYTVLLALGSVMVLALGRTPTSGVASPGGPTHIPAALQGG
jgi:hypothetical protein